MKTPLQYAQRIQEKRDIFNPDGQSLDIVKLNRYVNGVPGKTKPVSDDKYLHTSMSFGHRSISTSHHPETDGGRTPGGRPGTATFLKATLARDFMDGQHGQALKEVAHAVTVRTFADGGVLVNSTFRERLQQLAEAYADLSESSYPMPVPELDSEDQPERPWAFSEAALEKWVDQLEPVGGPDLLEVYAYLDLSCQEDRVRARLETIYPRRLVERI
jgi:hypothetical protein